MLSIIAAAKNRIAIRDICPDTCEIMSCCEVMIAFSLHFPSSLELEKLRQDLIVEVKVGTNNQKAIQDDFMLLMARIYRQFLWLIYDSFMN